MSYKDTTLSTMKGSTIASIFLGGGGGSKKCYSDRSLYSLLIIMTINKIQLRVKSELRKQQYTVTLFDRNHLAHT